MYPREQDLVFISIFLPDEKNEANNWLYLSSFVLY